MQDDNRRKRKKIIILVAAILVVVVAIICAFYFSSKIRATTMRILRMEGEVSLEENGKSKSVRENLRLNSGNALSTAVKSLVSIGLDETKIITLDELSRAVFSKAGRKLDLELTDGSLFFEVQKPLEDDEKLDIRTSTMIVGIRGTSGWVSVEGDHESMIVSDGHVHIIGTNHVTGEQKEIEVFAGQRISTYLYNDRDVDSIMFYLEQVTERDLPEFMLERLRENPELLDKVCKETGWDKPWILGIEMSGLTPTPTPTEAPKNDLNDKETEITPTVTPTATPVPTAPPEQNDLEALLAMITPTPTPTPVPVQETNDEDDEEEDEEEEENTQQINLQSTGGPYVITGQNFATGYGAAISQAYVTSTAQQGLSLPDLSDPSHYPVSSLSGYDVLSPNPTTIKVTGNNVDIKLPLRTLIGYSGGNAGFDVDNMDNVSFDTNASGNIYKRIAGNTDFIMSYNNGTTTYSYGDSTDKYQTKTVKNGAIELSDPVDSNSPTSISISETDGSITVTP